MSDKVLLKAPPGTDEANHTISFGKPYRVDNNGIVEVDAVAVGPLLERGGFTLVQNETTTGSVGMIKMMHLSDRKASCSFNGVTYEADADGVVTVPAEAANALMSHGFVVAPERVAKAAEPAHADPVETKKVDMPVDLLKSDSDPAFGADQADDDATGGGKGGKKGKGV